MYKFNTLQTEITTNHPGSCYSMLVFRLFLTTTTQHFKMENNNKNNIKKLKILMNLWNIYNNYLSCWPVNPILLCQYQGRQNDSDLFVISHGNTESTFSIKLQREIQLVRLLANYV